MWKTVQIQNKNLSPKKKQRTKILMLSKINQPWGCFYFAKIDFFGQEQILRFFFCFTILTYKKLSIVLKILLQIQIRKIKTEKFY